MLTFHARCAAAPEAVWPLPARPRRRHPWRVGPVVLARRAEPIVARLVRTLAGAAQRGAG